MFGESFPEAWRLRFGEEPTTEVARLGRLLSHRSVRKYTEEPVSEEIIAALIGAAQSASTSSNLQLWSVVSIQNPERRGRLAEMCDNQSQVREAAWFFAFLADHHRLRLAAREVGESVQALDYTEYFLMAAIDAALAAERMVCAAEALGLGVCYIGSLRNDPEGVARELELPEGAFGLFGLTVGWPDESAKPEIKPRLHPSSVWFREKYDAEVSTEEYNVRMSQFYQAQNMKGEVTWAMRSGRRVSEKYMSGRTILLEWLQGRGWLRR